MKKLKIHPAAGAFPMMPDDELDELAEDIKANGQRHPILLDQDGKLVDGRNRLEACKRAGVEPKFERLNGEDSVALVVSENISRRQLTKGQKAMALAILYPKSEQGKRTDLTGKTSVKITEVNDVNAGALSHARAVLHYAPDMAKLVVKGAIALSEAYEKAQENKWAIATRASDMERLSREAPDLATQVTEGDLHLDLAIQELRERKDNAELIAKAIQGNREEICRRIDALLFYLRDEERIKTFAPVYAKRNAETISALEQAAEEIKPIETVADSMSAAEEACRVIPFKN